MTLRFPYSFDQRSNPGFTLARSVSEPSVIASGDGKVVAVGSMQPFWAFSAGSTHATNSSYQVVVEHGYGVTTVVHGLHSVAVRIGQHVSRGDVLGQALTDEIFFAVLHNGNAYDPASLNRHFKTQNGNEIGGQGGMLRFAPDRIARDLSNSVLSTLVAGKRYFYNALCLKSRLMVNIDFNGNGQKVGLAADGITTSDFWNVYVPEVFQESIFTGPLYYCGGSTFTVDPVQHLNDYTNTLSNIRLERVAPLTADAGAASTWDHMLSTWIGGYPEGSPVQSSFKLKGFTSGTYRILLYSAQQSGGQASDFYVSVNMGTPVLLQNTPTGALSFVLNDNYVQTDVVLSDDDVVLITVVGFLSGLQVKRL